MSLSHHDIQSVSEFSGYSQQWWTETTRMVERGWRLFCEKRGMNPSVGPETLDVRQRKRGRPSRARAGWMCGNGLFGGEQNDC